MTTITTASGRTRELPLWVDADQVAGLDEDGRIVVDTFGAREGGPASADFLFGLTLCCDAFDKGVEDGIVCRACYGDSDTGNYLWRDAESGDFYGLDPVVKVAP